MKVLARAPSFPEFGIGHLNPMIISNKAQCRKCSDIIESTHGWDFVRCKCGAIAVDGGKNYLRRAFYDKNDIIELSEFKECKHENVTAEQWYGTFGNIRHYCKDCRETLRFEG